jgi:hypothetical protein
MEATGNYQSTARFSAMIDLKAKNLTRLIDGQFSFRREMAQPVPEFARDAELWSLMRRINEDINRFWSGLTQTYPSQFAEVLGPQINRGNDPFARSCKVGRRDHEEGTRAEPS